MGLFRAPSQAQQKPPKRSRLSLLLFLIVVYIGVRLFTNPSPHLRWQQPHLPKPPPVPVLLTAGIDDASATDLQIYHFTGMRVRGNGSYLNLGDRHTHLPASILTRFFPAPLIIPSCLTEPPPTGQTKARPLPIADDWPGFFGAPWTARVDGNLIALLHVAAPRDSSKPVAPPEFQIYADYSGGQTGPNFSTQAPATFTRGSKAVLYRVFLNGPVRCLDLVVKNGENNGTGHLYYEKYHHFYETDTTFQIQP